MEDIKSDNIDENLDGLKFPTPASVLEAEIDSNKKENLSPMGETVLAIEADKPKTGGSAVNVKANPIESTVNDQVKNTPNKSDSEVKSTPIQVIKSESTETVKIVTVPVQIPAPTPAVVATSGNTYQTLIGPTSSINESNATNQLGTTVSALTEKEILKSVLNTETLSSKISNTVKDTSSSILKSGTSFLKQMSSSNSLLENSTLEKVTSPEDLIMSAFLPAGFKEALEDKGIKIKGPENILSAVEKGKETLSEVGEFQKSKIGSDAILKTGKLADSNSVKQILTPDRTLEKSVSKLTRELPESINNLSSSFSTFSPQSSNITNVMNEGSKIDQSSTVNSMQSASGQNRVMTENPQSAKEQAGMNQNEFYLQAIYSALVSGKIRVKIEHL